MPGFPVHVFVAVVVGGRMVAKTVARVERRVDVYCLALLLGYGFFRVLLNATYSSAMSTVRDMTSVNAVNFEFSFASSFSILLTSAALVAWSCMKPGSRLHVAGIVSAAALLIMNILSGIGVFGGLLNEAGMIALASIWGLTSIVTNAAWLVPFVGMGPRRCLTTLIASMLVSALISLGLSTLPGVAQDVLLTGVGLASIVLFCFMCRAKDPVKAPMVCLEGVEPARPGRESLKRTTDLLGELWGPIVIFASLTMLSGFVASFVESGQCGSAEAASGVSLFATLEAVGISPTSLASLSAVVFLAVLAFVANRTFDLTKTFRFAFPFIALLLVALPFTDRNFDTFFQASLSFLSTIVNVSIMFLMIETARVRQAPAVAVVASSMFIARAALLVSLVAGMVLDARDDFDGTVRAMALVVAGIYLLSMTLVLLTRKQGKPAAGVSVSLTSEDVAFNRPQAAAAASEAGEGGPEVRAVPEPVDQVSQASPAPTPLEARAADLAAKYHLTPREHEVVLLLAQGRSAPFIGNELGLATNTVRGYVQEAYAKLDVHSKQELIDLLTIE